MTRTLLVAGLALSLAPQPSAPHDHLSAERKCVVTIKAHHWPAGDLCDTLPPNVKITAAKWANYNRLNGWIEVKNQCWDCSATTDQPYVICHDGTIRKG